jgi:hypothetical protein
MSDGPAPPDLLKGMREPVNRAEWQTLSRERVLDAEALLREKRWAFAYYVSGYAVECALKSCLLARMIETGLVFQPKFVAAKCLTHVFEELIDFAGMRELLNEKLTESAVTNLAFVENWDKACLWTSEARYLPKSDAEAMALRDAIIDQTDGILPWITKYW